MSNQLRFRSGQVFLHRLRVDSGTTIEAGDLVFLDTDDVKPASDFPFTTDLVTTQGNFAAAFLGVAHQQSADGETDDEDADETEKEEDEEDSDDEELDLDWESVMAAMNSGN